MGDYAIPHPPRLVPHLENNQVRCRLTYHEPLAQEARLETPASTTMATRLKNLVSQQEAMHELKVPFQLVPQVAAEWPEAAKEVLPSGATARDVPMSEHRWGLECLECSPITIHLAAWMQRMFRQG